MTNEPNAEDAPKLQIDSAWKAEAQAEKERLAEQEKETAAGPGEEPGRGTLPEANFKSLVGVLASQAIMGLGTMQDPETKGIVIDLEGARFGIDLLGVIEEKTKGNLSEEEASELKQLLSELRSRFIQVTQLVAQQAASGNLGTPPAGVGTPPPAP
jgi:hypothetical protein